MIFGISIFALCALQIGAIICAVCLARKIKCHAHSAAGVATAEGGDVAGEGEIQESTE